MLEFGGLWKHENNQHALVPPKTECGFPSGAEELKTVTYATPPREERRKKDRSPGRSTGGIWQYKATNLVLFLLFYKCNQNKHACLSLVCLQQLFSLCAGLERKKADKEYVAMEVDVVSQRNIVPWNLMS